MVTITLLINKLKLRTFFSEEVIETLFTNIYTLYTHARAWTHTDTYTPLISSTWSLSYQRQPWLETSFCLFWILLLKFLLFLLSLLKSNILMTQWRDLSSGNYKNSEDIQLSLFRSASLCFFKPLLLCGMLVPLTFFTENDLAMLAPP